MVKGRFGAGQSLQDAKTDDEEITPGLIREQPEIPAGRFGRGLAETERLRQRALTIREVRQEAIEEANRLEREFFGAKGVTIQQVEENFEQVDPRIRQFIKTTPARKREETRKIIEKIQERIEQEKQKVRTSKNEDVRFEAEVLADNLQRLIGEARTGAFTFGDIFDVAQSRTQSRVQRALARREGRERLIEKGVPRELARRLISQAGTARPKITLTTKEAQALTPEARQVLGVEFITTTEQITETRPFTIPELIDKGLSPALARRLSLSPENATITLEEFERLSPQAKEFLDIRRENFIEGEKKTFVSLFGKEFEIPEKLAQRFAVSPALKSSFEEIPGLVKFQKAVGRGVESIPLMGLGVSGAKKPEKFSQIERKAFESLIPTTPIGVTIDIATVGGGFVVDKAISRLAKLSTKFIGTGKVLQTSKEIKLAAGTAVVGGIIGLESKRIKEEIEGKSALEKTEIITKDIKSFALFGAGARGSQLLKEELIVAKEAPKELKLGVIAEKFDLRQLEKQVNVDRFVVLGEKEGRTAFVATRGELLKSKVFGVQLPKELTIEQTELAFKERLGGGRLAELALRGRFIDIEKASSVVLTTESAITKGGKIIRPAFRESKDVAFMAAKATPSRTSPVVIGKFEGALERDIKKLRLLDTKKLSAMDRRLLEEIEKKLVFKKEAEVFFGTTETKDILKILGKGKEIRILGEEEKARSVARGRLVGVQEEKELLQFERKFGLKEREVLEERIAFADITFPRIPKLKPTAKRLKEMGVELPKEIKFPRTKTFEEIPEFKEALRERKILGFFTEKSLDLPQGKIFVDTKNLSKRFGKLVERHERAHLIDIKLGITKKLEKRFRKEKILKLERDIAAEEVPFGTRRKDILKEIFAQRFERKRQFERLTKAIKEPFTDIKPRKVDLLKGITIRKEIELPPPKSVDLIFRKGIKPKRTTEQFQQLFKIPEQELKIPSKAITIEAAKSAAALRAKRLLKVRPVSAKQIEKQLQRELQGTKSLADVSLAALTIPKTKLEERLIPAEATTVKLQSRLIEKQIAKTQVKLSTKLVPKEVVKSTTKLTTKLTPRLTTKLTTKALTKTIIRIPTQQFRELRFREFQFRIPRFKPTPLGKPKRIKRQARSDAALVEGFTARILRLPPQRIREKDLEKALRRQERGILGIRRRPVVIRERELNSFNIKIPDSLLFGKPRKRKRK